MIDLGDVAKDTISGLKGVVTSKVTFLNGCVRLCITPQEVKDGKAIEGSYFDIEQCVLVSSKVAKKGKPGGGPMPDAKRQADPRR